MVFLLRPVAGAARDCRTGILFLFRFCERVRAKSTKREIAGGLQVVLQPSSHAFNDKVDVLFHESPYFDFDTFDASCTVLVAVQMSIGHC